MRHFLIVVNKGDFRFEVPVSGDMDTLRSALTELAKSKDGFVVKSVEELVEIPLEEIYENV